MAPPATYPALSLHLRYRGPSSTEYAEKWVLYDSSGSIQPSLGSKVLKSFNTVIRRIVKLIHPTDTSEHPGHARQWGPEGSRGRQGLDQQGASFQWGRPVAQNLEQT